MLGQIFTKAQNKITDPANRHQRQPTWCEQTPDGRWRAFSREELLARDKASLDVFWLRDATMTNLDNLPSPRCWQMSSSSTCARRWRALSLSTRPEPVGQRSMNAGPFMLAYTVAPAVSEHPL